MLNKTDEFLVILDKFISRNEKFFKKLFFVAWFIWIPLPIIMNTFEVNFLEYIFWLIFPIASLYISVIFILAGIYNWQWAFMFTRIDGLGILTRITGFILGIIILISTIFITINL